MFVLSTVTQFIGLIIFAITLNVWGLNEMLLMMVAFLCLFAIQQNSHFFHLIKRLKWFFLVMFLIFLFNTPGEHIVSWPYSIKPTYEGLQTGLKQMLRITLMLSALSLMLTKNTTQQLISGLYFLMKPLAAIGIDTKRFVARLWLTLHYVDQESTRNRKATSMAADLAGRLNSAFTDDVETVDVVIEKPMLTWMDYVVIFAMLMLLVILLTR